tara:strand:+ start:2044 stop:3180 length:1137 start_codon:yes stop_codon:yes gene_type:complete
LKYIYATASNIISPLGYNTASNYNASAKGNTSITLQRDHRKLPLAFYASLMETELLNQNFATLANPKGYTRLEKMMMLSIAETLSQQDIEINERTALIISTTKGNIDVLEKDSPFDKERVHLSSLAGKIQEFFKFPHEPIVVSNACVSGILAVAVAKRLIMAGTYDNAVIVAGDIISQFTLSGFYSFQALSHNPCKPYSKYRDGISLGEAAASLVVTSTGNAKNSIKIVGDASCNDANHISGPSRTGEGLFKSITRALDDAGLQANDIDYISAHGTATIFNDEMEGIALNRCNMTHVPLNSFKGIYGHTLGASGLLEAILGLEAMKNDEVLASVGYDEPGVSKPINVIKENKKVSIDNFLKTASGFGGCNTAVIFQKA